jgi:hypothetical protein
MDPQQTALGLLSAQKIYGNALRFVGTPLGVLMDVADSQPSYQQAAYSRADVPPQYRFQYRPPDTDESYDMIAKAAMERRAKLDQIAKEVRARGHGPEVVQQAWKSPALAKMFNVGGNPNDLLRGAGRMTPKAGGIQYPGLKEYGYAPMRVTPGYGATNAIPTKSRGQQLLEWLRDNGIIETTGQENLD